MTSERVVVGFDGSESSRVALTWALGAAHSRGLPVRVVHVLAPVVGATVGFGTFVAAADSRWVAAERMLLAAEHESRRELPGVSLETRIVSGPVVPTLLEQLRDAEMAVVGSRGLSTFAELLVGSTAYELVTYAPCPVVVVRSLEYTAPGPEDGRVVVGVDGSGGCAETIAFAFQEASSRGTGLTAVHAWTEPFVEVPGRESSLDENVLVEVETAEQRLLAEAMAGWSEKYPDVPVRQLVVHGEPVEVLVAASAGAQLVVVGARGRGGFRSLLLGSVSHGLLHHARTAVAVVRREP